LEYWGDRVGFLVDVGANDGITFSNSRALLERKWKGMLVDPNPTAFRLLVDNSEGFEGVTVHNVACLDCDCIVELNVPSSDGNDPIGTSSFIE